MRFLTILNHVRWSGWLLVLTALVGTPSVGQNSNFGNLTLNLDKAAGVLSGSTGGSASLPAIVASSDRHDNKCLGYGDPNPDHILILKQNLPSLKLQVNSGGADTTLIVQGADGVIRCGVATPTKKDATIVDTDWQAGSYKVWVGTTEPGVRRNYKLSVRQ